MCQSPNVCDICSDGYVSWSDNNGFIECLSEETGCPTGYYDNHQGKCLQCDAACTSCAGPSHDHCTQCPSAEVLVPHQKLRLDRLNHENTLGFELGEMDFSITYGTEDPEDEVIFGTCAVDCMVEGFATWDNSGVCELCKPHGCTACDTDGLCTECDKSKGLSLITDPLDSSIVHCAPCEVSGCKLCNDADHTQCQMCKKGFSLHTNDEGDMVCVRKCPEGLFSEVTSLDVASAPEFMTNLDHRVCSPCDSACDKCKDASDFCLLCSDPALSAQPDGSCTTGCPDGFFEIDRSCKK